MKNKSAIAKELTARLAALLDNKRPSARDASEVRKVMTMLHALDDAAATGNDRGAAVLLKAMPYVRINDSDELVLDKTSIQGLGKMDQEGITQLAEGAGKVFKGLFNRLKNRKKKKNKTPFLDKTKDFFAQRGTRLADKLKDFLNNVKPSVNVDLTSSLKENWWVILLGAAGITGVAVVGYKIAKGK